jgi:hypothetical protein
MKDLQYYAKKSLTGTGRSLECDITLDVDGEAFRAYEVYVGKQDLLFLTEKGTLTYLVDRYGDRLTVELFEVNKD